MKWISHKITTGAVVFALSGDPAGALISAAASTFPDFVEGKDYESPKWRKNHRKVSHWWVAYCAASAVFFFWTYLHYGKVPPLFQALSRRDVFVFVPVCMYLFLGSTLHVLEDALCGKVPLLNPLRRTFGLLLFRVGSAAEYGFVCAIVGIFMFVTRIFRTGGIWY